jgi:hypothetical protein
MAMKTQLIACGLALLGSAACREKPSTYETGQLGVGKPVESSTTKGTMPPPVEPARPGDIDTPAAHDDDFIQTRSSFETTTRERLNRLDARIDQLESRTDSAGHNAAVRLRLMRDELLQRLKAAEDQTEAGWDRFEREVSDGVDELERDVDRLLGY